MQTIKQLTILIIIALLSACDGGNDEVKTGQFKDSAVKGLKYKTATQEGITDELGTYKYKKDELVEFYLGKMKLGEAMGADILYPKDIVAENIFNKEYYAIKYLNGAQL